MNILIFKGDLKYIKKKGVEYYEGKGGYAKNNSKQEW